MRYSWTCHCCGKQFDTLPLDYGADAPAYWYGLPEDERAKRAVLTADFCTIDGEHHFVRGCLEIPIVGRDDRLVWGAWTSLSAASAKRAGELWDRDPDPDEPPRFGWFSTSLPLYPPTLGLKALVRFRPRNLRPLIELEPTDHPLTREQREGITLGRVQAIAAELLHRGRT